MKKFFFSAIGSAMCCLAVVQPARAQTATTPYPLDISAYPGSFITQWVATGTTLNLGMTNYYNYSSTNTGGLSQYTLTLYDETTNTSVTIQAVNPSGGIPVTQGDTYDFIVTPVTANLNGYPVIINMSMSTTGTIPNMTINPAGSASMLTGVLQWGSIVFRTVYGLAENSAPNFTVSATDVPIFSNNTVPNPLNSGEPNATTQSLSYMFYNTPSLTDIPNINSWSFPGATSTAATFANSAFNGDISSWDMSNITNVDSMFMGNVNFDGDLSNWNTAKVQTFIRMFNGATTFNQDLGSWSLAKATNLTDMLSNSGLSCANFDATLIGWATGGTAPQNIPFGATGLSYDATNPDVAAALATLIGDGWTYNGAAQSVGDITTGVFGATANSGDCPLKQSLPIKLLSFTAQAQGNAAVLLQWVTATETNNKGFAIQRSADGANWQNIAFVNSDALNGNSSAQLNYSYTDVAPLNGTNYYRLVQTDIDGTVAYSAVQTVQMSVNTAQANIYPNPAKSTLNVSVQTVATYQLVNAAGAIVAKGTLNAGNNELNVSGLAEGIYFLNITATGAGSSTHEVEIMR